MYTLMAHADGLIGDYSSASLQYLLLDRPEAYVVPDLEDYKNTRGFVYDDPEAYKGSYCFNWIKEICLNFLLITLWIEFMKKAY